jgi:hypothetical protein
MMGQFGEPSESYLRLVDLFGRGNCCACEFGLRPILHYNCTKIIDNHAPAIKL